jgi:hypothetical protein
MQITIEELFNSQEGFTKLVRNESIAAAIKLRLRPITVSFDQHLKDAQETRVELFKKYGTPIESDPENFEIKPDDKAAQKAVSDAWREVLATEVTIPGKKIKFENISGAPLTTGDLVNLEWLIEFPAEVEEELPQAAQAATA